jgi:hypothetical protein
MERRHPAAGADGRAAERPGPAAGPPRGPGPAARCAAGAGQQRSLPCPPDGRGRGGRHRPAAAAGRGLRERHFGIWQGHTYQEVEAGWPEQSERWRRREPDFGPEGGETLQQFFDRVVASATRLARAHAGQTLVLVAHGGVLDCLYRAASRIALNAPRTWELPNTGVNRLLWTGEGFTLVGWGDVHHR